MTDEISFWFIRGELIRGPVNRNIPVEKRRKLKRGLQVVRVFKNLLTFLSITGIILVCFSVVTGCGRVLTPGVKIASTDLPPGELPPGDSEGDTDGFIIAPVLTVVGEDQGENRSMQDIVTVMPQGTWP